MTDRRDPKPKEAEDPDKAPVNVTLPPIDATPEEIAQALLQRPPKKKPKESDERLIPLAPGAHDVACVNGGVKMYRRGGAKMCHGPRR